jgi:ABC-type antimicrobial peptide transport system permease subunit
VLGQRIRIHGAEREIVGVVRDGRYRSLGDRPTPFAFIPFQQAYLPIMLAVVRHRSGFARAAAVLRHEVSALNPNIGVDRPRSLRSIVDVWILPQRVAAGFVSVFGLAGLALAAMGIYGVLAYLVGCRTREFGIRLALGARRGALAGLVMREGMQMVLIGTVVGTAAATLLTRPIARFLYGVDALDPLTFVVVPVVLSAIAALASYLPARRAAGVDPMISLRAE